MSDNEFPNGLRVAMDAAGKGPTEVSEAIGTNRQNVTRWSKGQRKLTVDWARKIAPVLDTTPEQLLLDNAPAPSLVIATSVKFDDATMWLDLSDGRTLGVPLDWFPWLHAATPTQRFAVEISRHGLHWTSLGHEVALTSLLAGR